MTTHIQSNFMQYASARRTPFRYGQRPIVAPHVVSSPRVVHGSSGVSILGITILTLCVILLLIIGIGLYIYFSQGVPFISTTASFINLTNLSVKLTNTSTNKSVTIAAGKTQTLSVETQQTITSSFTNGVTFSFTPLNQAPNPSFGVTPFSFVSEDDIFTLTVDNASANTVSIETVSVLGTFATSPSSVDTSDTVSLKNAYVGMTLLFSSSSLDNEIYIVQSPTLTKIEIQSSSIVVT